MAVFGFSIGSAMNVIDLNPLAESLAKDVLQGLGQEKKTIPPKYFYDEAGSLLFEKICLLDEYPVTRAELGLLRRHAQEICSSLGEDCILFELS